MGMIRKAMWMLVVAALILVVVAPRGEAAIGCGTVFSDVSGCFPYVTGQGGLGNCCEGIKTLYGAAQTTADKQSICSCLKSATASYPGINYNKVAGLLSQCHLNIPYKISPSTDCSKIH